MSYEHLEFRHNGKLYTLTVGQRFEIIFHHLFSDLGTVTSGIVIGIVDEEESYLSKLWNNGMFSRPKIVMVVAMDGHFNNQPTSNERLYANQYNLAASRILVIPQGSIQKTVMFRWMRTSPAREYGDNNDVVMMCNHPTCKCFRSKGSLLMLCDDHVFCKSHLLIGSENRGRFILTEDAVAEFFSSLDLKAKETGLSTELIETKAAVYASSWKSVQHKDDAKKDSFLQGVLKGDCMICPVCQMYGNKVKVPLSDIHRQLFATPEQEYSGTAGNNKVLLSDFRAKLLPYSKRVPQKTELQLAQEREEWELQEAIRMSMSVVYGGGEGGGGNAGDVGDLDAAAQTLRNASHTSVNNEVVITDMARAVEPYVLQDTIFIVSDSRNPEGLHVDAPPSTTVKELKERSLQVLRQSNRLVSSQHAALPPPSHLTAENLSAIGISSPPKPPQSMMMTTMSALDNRRYKLLVIDHGSAEEAVSAGYDGKNAGGEAGGGIATVASQLPWRKELSLTSWKSADDPYAASICELPEVTYIEVRESVENIGPPMSITNLPIDFKYNKSLIQKTKNLSRAFAGFRKIRGDGNCYYRAVLYGLLEQIILHNDRERFKRLSELFTACADEIQSSVRKKETEAHQPTQVADTIFSAAKTEAKDTEESFVLVDAVDGANKGEEEGSALLAFAQAIDAESAALKIEEEKKEIAKMRHEKWLKNQQKKAEDEKQAAERSANADTKAFPSAPLPSERGSTVGSALDTNYSEVGEGVGDTGDNNRSPLEWAQRRISACRVTAALMLQAHAGLIWRNVRELEASVLGALHEAETGSRINSTSYSSSSSGGGGGSAIDASSDTTTGNNAMSVDMSFVLAARSLLAAFIMSHRNMSINEFSLEAFLLTSYPEHETLDSYCEEYVLSVDMSAEGPFVCLGLLCTALCCKCITVFLDRDPKVPLNFFASAETNELEDAAKAASSSPAPTTSSADAFAAAKAGATAAAAVAADASKPIVYLLLRPGHYDLLYASHIIQSAEHPAYSEADLVHLCITQVAAADGNNCAGPLNAAAVGSAVDDGSLVAAKAAAKSTPVKTIVGTGDSAPFASPSSLGSTGKLPSASRFSVQSSITDSFSDLMSGAGAERDGRSFSGLSTSLPSVVNEILTYQRQNPIRPAEAAVVVLPSIPHITLQSVWPNVNSSKHGVYLYVCPAPSSLAAGLPLVPKARVLTDGGRYVSRSVHKIRTLKVPHDELIAYSRSAFGVANAALSLSLIASTQQKQQKQQQQQQQQLHEVTDEKERDMVSALKDGDSVLVRVNSVIQLTVDLSEIDLDAEYRKHEAHTVPVADLQHHLGTHSGVATLYVDASRFSGLPDLYSAVAKLLGLPLTGSFDLSLPPPKPDKKQKQPQAPGGVAQKAAGAAVAAPASGYSHAAALQTLLGSADELSRKALLVGAAGADNTGVARTSYHVKVIDPKFCISVVLNKANVSNPRKILVNSKGAVGLLRAMKEAVSNEFQLNPRAPLHLFQSPTAEAVGEVLNNDQMAANVASGSIVHAFCCSVNEGSCVSCTAEQQRQGGGKATAESAAAAVGGGAGAGAAREEHAVDLQVANDFPYVMPSCNHSLCLPCGTQVLKQFAPPPLPAAAGTGAEKGEAALGTMFTFVPLPAPGDAQDFVQEPPTLSRAVCCPIPNCGVHLRDDEVDMLPAYQAERTRSIAAYADQLLVLRSYRTCIFSAVVCGLGPEPFQNLLQLGCSHFMHPDCLEGYVTNQIDNADLTHHIVCFMCAAEKTCCYCPSCMPLNGEGDGMLRPDRHPTGAHILTHDEVRTLVNNEECVNMTQAMFDRWDALYARFSTRHIGGGGRGGGGRGGGGEDVGGGGGGGGDDQNIECGSCGVPFLVPAYMMNGTAGIACPYCKKTMCTGCKKEAHPGLTCKQFQEKEFLEFCAAADIKYLQYCPSCNYPWYVPLECLHVTCHIDSISFQGCGMEFCFLCAAPYSPIRMHGNSFHRRECDLYKPCCDENCSEEKLADGTYQPVCVQEAQKYFPGPCTECRNSESIEVHNGCTHAVAGDWKACYTCRTNEVPRRCTHWCKECEFAKKPCSRPKDNGELAKHAGAGTDAAAAAAAAASAAGDGLAVKAGGRDVEPLLQLYDEEGEGVKDEDDDFDSEDDARWSTDSGGSGDGDMPEDFLAATLPCGDSCKESHSSFDDCVKCGRRWGMHASHICPGSSVNAGKRGAFIKGSLPKMPNGADNTACVESCSLLHNRDDSCVKCGRRYAAHENGHRCPAKSAVNGGKRGSFISGQLPGGLKPVVGCDPACTASHDSKDGCILCGARYGLHNGHTCPTGTANDGKRGSFIKGPLKGCPQTCQASHENTHICLSCNKRYGLHSGHSCPNNSHGKRGSFPVTAAAAASGTAVEMRAIVRRPAKPHKRAAGQNEGGGGAADLMAEDLVGCGPSCTKHHDATDACVVCRMQYGAHTAGHKCPIHSDNPMGRASFMKGPLPAAKHRGVAAKALVAGRAVGRALLAQKGVVGAAEAVAPICKNGHFMVAGLYTHNTCNGCRRGITCNYRCVECDWDLCPTCTTKARAAVGGTPPVAAVAVAASAGDGNVSNVKRYNIHPKKAVDAEQERLKEGAGGAGRK